MHDLLSENRVGLSYDIVRFLLNGKDQLASRNTDGISFPRHLRGCSRLLQPSRHALLGLSVRNGAPIFDRLLARGNSITVALEYAIRDLVVVPLVTDERVLR